MRSKNKKKRKSAYRRGERLILFFKRGTAVLLVIAVIAAAALGIKLLINELKVTEILLSGNYHLEREDIISAMEISEDEPLLRLDLEDIAGRLNRNTWVKDVTLRKQFPGRLEVKIREAVPMALLRINKRLYLVDEDGRVLERVQGKTPPFLPVLQDISPLDEKGITEALKLVMVLSEKKSLIARESIEIGLKSYGLTMKIDGEFIKVGYGGYAEKFKRWIELEPEIRKRGLPIKYVDLRFKDSVIVKPAKKTRRGTSS